VYIKFSTINTSTVSVSPNLQNIFIGNDFYTVLSYTFTNTTYRLNRRGFEYRPVVAT